MSGGYIVQSGRHEDLIKEDGVYSEFINVRKKANWMEHWINGISQSLTRIKILVKMFLFIGGYIDCYILDKMAG